MTVPIQTLLVLFERVFGDFEKSPPQPTMVKSKQGAALADIFSSAKDRPASDYPHAQIAAYLEGNLDDRDKDAVRKHLADNPEAFQDLLASAAFLEQLSEVAEDVPPGLLEFMAKAAPPKAANENDLSPWLDSHFPVYDGFCRRRACGRHGDVLVASNPG